MTTEVVSTIRASGGDYTTLSTWEAGEQGNLVSADEIRTAECYDDWGSGLNNSVAVAGSTTDSTRFMKITVANGHRHDGTPQSGFFIYTSKSFSGAVSSTDAYTVVEWLDVTNTSTTLGIAFNTSGAAQSTSSHIKCIGAADSVVFNTIHRCVSCLAWGIGNGFITPAGTGARYLSNCVAANLVLGFKFAADNSGVEVKNCVAYNCTTSYENGGYVSASSTHNATSTGSDDAPGGDSVISVDSADFVDASGNDFHLASGSALIGVGTNLYSDFTTDIDGDTWPSSGAWDIGFDYYVAAGGAPTITALSARSITATSAQPRITYA